MALLAGQDIEMPQTLEQNRRDIRAAALDRGVDAVEDPLGDPFQMTRKFEDWDCEFAPGVRRLALGASSVAEKHGRVQVLYRWVVAVVTGQEAGEDTSIRETPVLSSLNWVRQTARSPSAVEQTANLFTDAVEV